MFYAFFYTFVAYVSSLLLFPLYKFYITSRLYIYVNLFFLFCLLLITTLLSYSILIVQDKFLVTFELNNFLNNIVDYSFIVSLTPLSFFFSYLVIIIGFTTNIYTLNYFKGEADESIFVFWLNSFIASMLSLVLANSFYSLFLGWELIGLTSFFLINFWQTRRSTLKSSFKAFSFNLVSDIFLLAAFVCFYKVTNTTDCETFIYISLWDNLLNNVQLQAGLFFLVICASIKSVQLGGHLWLPDSMEAPVPASSLIHSATLVSAGIFLLCKFSPLYIALNWTSYMILLGSLTAAYGGLVSASQTDLKKLLAYSTMSHCGFLWVLASSGNFFITIFYLFLHGLFKAASFYCAGSFIRNYGSQDSRLMGSSHIFFRLDTILFLVCSANLGGLPLTFGYFFKSFFIKFIFLNITNLFSISFLIIGLLLSLLYFFRLTFYVIFDFYKNYKQLNITALQLVTINTSNILRLTSLPHLLAVSFLLIFSVIFIIIFNNYYTDSIVLLDIFDVSGLTFVLINLTILYKTYYLYFYFIYILLASSLLLISYRRSLFALESTMALFFMFLLFFFIKCGVTL